MLDVVRRLRHFSGYDVPLGFFSEQSADVFTGCPGRHVMYTSRGPVQIGRGYIVVAG